MYTFEECQEIIKIELNKLLLKKEPVNLYTPIEYILSNGGKRIRPVLTLMSCNLFSESVNDAIIPALAIEFFHNFTLLHDDIMDNADIRRGKPTVHKKWNTSSAILSGDAMCILAYDLLLKTKPEISSKILPEFTKTALEVCKGQQYDMDFENQNDVSVDQYLKMILLKTAVLIASSMKIGALTGGAGEKDAQLLYEFGENIGLAFQLQDDLLDAYGDESKFGKKNGGDIVANKKTYLLIKALELAQDEDYQMLVNILGSQGIDPEEKISLVLEIYDKLNIKEITSILINNYYNAAFKNIQKLSLDAERTKQIIYLTNSLMNRIL